MLSGERKWVFAGAILTILTTSVDCPALSCPCSRHRGQRFVRQSVHAYSQLCAYDLTGAAANMLHGAIASLRTGCPATLSSGLTAVQADVQDGVTGMTDTTRAQK